MNDRPHRRETRKQSPDAVERLYVLWLGSTILLALAVVVVVFFVRGALREQAGTLAELTDRLTQLERVVVELDRNEPASPERTVRESRRPATRTPPPTTGPATAAAAADAAPSSSALLEELLDRALAGGPDGRTRVVDPVAAKAAIVRAHGVPEDDAQLDRFWPRLAVAALLVGEGQAGDDFARRAAAAGNPACEFLERAARQRVGQDQLVEAAEYAQRLVDATGGASGSRLLLAEILLRQDDVPAADAAVANMATADLSDTTDRLRLGRVLIALEDWDRLAQLLDTLARVPDDLAAERNFQRAVLLVQQVRTTGVDDGRLTEALALLDHRLGTTPDDYDCRVWYGVALTESRQFDAARAALTAVAEQSPARPQAWYWRGMVEVAAQKPAAAAPYLQNALVASARYAPAWEALGLLALNAGDLTTAVEHLSNAIAANNRRASAHFLLALAHAKGSRREQAAAALREALRLDPTLIEKALQAEVLARLFEPEELESMLGDDPDSAGETRVEDDL